MLGKEVIWEILDKGMMLNFGFRSIFVFVCWSCPVISVHISFTVFRWMEVEVKVEYCICLTQDIRWQCRVWVCPIGRVVQKKGWTKWS